MNSATDIEKAKQVVNTALYELNVDRIEEIKSSPFFWIERTTNSTVEDTVASVEKHFDYRLFLDKPPNIVYHNRCYDEE